MPDPAARPSPTGGSGRDPGQERVGLWLVGARGSVAATVAVGVLGVRAGLAGTDGCVGELPEVAVAGLVPVAGLELGGHDVSTAPLGKQAERLAEGGVVPAPLVSALSEELDALDARVRPGLGASGEPVDRVAAERVRDDVVAFAAEHGLDRVVVLDVSSTEPRTGPDPAHDSLAAFERALDAGQPLPLSSVYAWAAYRAGCPFVSFTPSPGPRLPALVELAATLGLPWGGSDGKTGETLLKTVLAPMFATRDLRVRSWASYNMLGGGDGATLADPRARASKIASKGRGLEAILGHPVDGPMHIDHVADLGDWKTAWDHVSFSGFLGTRMTMQVTWQGCDSALAAPLVIDLARLAARAHACGEQGPMAALGFFFKDPAGSEEHRLSAQWDHLVRWAAELADRAPTPSA